MSDNALTKVAQAVIRLVAFGLIVTSALLCLGEIYFVVSLLDNTSPPPPPRWGLLAVKCVPLLAGLVLAWKSRALADHFTKDSD